jgi:hypothetical protein
MFLSDDEWKGNVLSNNKPPNYSTTYFKIGKWNVYMDKVMNVGAD